MLAQQKRTWPKMPVHVTQFIRQCPMCQKQSQVKPVTHIGPFTVSSLKPFVRRAIDTVGPFFPDKDGNKCIIAIIDLFSRYVTLHPAKAFTPEEAISKALLPNIGHFGPPLQLVSDNGTQFVNSVVEEYLRVTGVEMVKIIPYSHEENSLVERYHKETLRFLQVLTSDLNMRERWSTIVPLVQRIMNAQVLPSIGCSPTQMIYGNAINTDQGIYLEFTKEEQEEMDLSEYTKEMLEKQALLVERARVLLVAHDVGHMVEAPPAPITEFAIGDYVLLSYPPGALSRPPTKLDTRWRGPYVVRAKDESLYTVRDLNSHKDSRVHVNRLKAFHYDATRDLPAVIALKDDHFMVEAVLDCRCHRGTFRRSPLSERELLVQWVGYGPEHNSWEPWHELRANVSLHRFLDSHGYPS